MREIAAGWLSILLMISMNTGIAFDRSSYLRQLQTTPVKHNVRIFLSLEYIREEVSISLESSLPADPIVAHFCKSVNYQASGAQVQAYSKALSASISTKLHPGNETTDYECRILGTNKINDEEGGHLFNNELVYVIEVAVEQTVHVVGDLTQDQISGIVMNGFNRGDGGRIKFRSLLQENEAFNTLVNVEVLREFLLPTVGFSNSPSGILTNPPSTLRLTTLSDMPSLVPSPVPSLRPSNNHTLLPSQSPTIAVGQENPTSLGEANVSASHNPQPLIMGAIAGGLATIAVSCFFIFCVWFPFCRKKRRNDEDSGNKAHRSTDMNSAHRDSTIPETLHLDDDSRSLANTTVTLGEKSSKKVSNSKSMAALTSDSFDETSIYTSTLPLASSDTERFCGSPDRDRRIIETVDEVNEVGIVDEVSDDDLSSQDVSAWKEAMERDEFREETRSTKGLDVFSEDDESSYDFGSIALSDPSFGPTVDKERDHRPTPSPSSTKTRRTMNLMSRRSADAGDPENEKKIENMEETNFTSGPQGRQSDTSSRTFDNNTLLRTILENARDKQRIGSSKASLKSAPPRFHELHSRNHESRSFNSTRLDDHLRRPEDQRHRPPKSTRSVGTYSKPIEHSLYKSTASLSGRVSVSSRHSQSSYGELRATKPSVLAENVASRNAYASNSSYRLENAPTKRADAPGVLGITSIGKAATRMSGATDQWDVEGNIESSSARSGTNSAWSVRSVQSDGTFSTDASQSVSYTSSKDIASTAEVRSKISALEHDLERIGQLSSFSRGDLSPESISSAGASRATYPTRSKLITGNRKQRIIVVAPPGKIGVVLINRHDGRGTVVSEIRSSSPVKGMLYTGDKLVAVDGKDVTGMDVREITSMMASRADRERRLTIISKRIHGTTKWFDESKETYSP